MDGIAGVYGIKDPELVNKAFLATAACQHRGKASTGLAIGNIGYTKRKVAEKINA